MSSPWPNQPRGPSLAAGNNPFAEDINPYAAPQDAGYVVPAPPNAGSYAGLWRQGDVLVMHKQAPLPDVCLKSNLPATRRLKRKMIWHHPAVYLVLLLNWLIYLIVALIIRKTATIEVPLTEEWFAIRRRRMLFAWSAVLLGMLLIVVPLLAMPQSDVAPFAVILGVLLSLGAAIYGLRACRLVWPKRITNDYIWLKGVHPDYLARLETWQWNL